MSQELQACLSSRRREMLDLARALIAVPTENPPGNAYRECARILRHRLRALGLRLDARTPGHCIRAVYGHGKPTLIFHGHYDVVPAALQEQFRPAVRNGKLFGRGSSDMKAGLVSMLYAVAALKESGMKLGGRIALHIVPDEETAGARGSRALVKSRLITGTSIGMLTPEPTGGVVWNASRGAISLRVMVKGKSAHAGLAHSGRNAFVGMTRVARELLALESEIRARKTRFAIRPEAARRSILLLGGRCEGGTNFNTVPAECSFTVDRRTNPEEDLAEEKQRLLKVLARSKHRGTDLEVEAIQHGEPSATPPDNALARALRASVRQVTGKLPRFEMCPGLLETRFYSQRGVPALAYGPGLLSVSHGPREFVPVEKIYDCALVYALTAARLLHAA